MSEKPTAEIRSLNGDVIDLRQANESVVLRLEDLLERAKSGEIIGLGVVAVYYDLATSHCTVGAVGVKAVGEMTLMMHETMGTL
jgi:hypothetical protein